MLRSVVGLFQFGEAVERILEEERTEGTVPVEN